MKKNIVMLVVAVLLLSVTGVCVAAQPSVSSAPGSEAFLMAQSTGNVASQSSVSGDPSAAEERLRIMYVVPAIAHPVFLTAKEAFEKAAADFNFEPIWAGSSVGDVNEMVKQIELGIVEKVDGIIAMAAAPTAMRPVLQRAHDANIPVVTVIADCSDADRLAYLGLNNQNYGVQAAAEALKGLNGRKPVIACMVPQFENQSGIEIIAALKEEFGKKGEYEWVTTVESMTDMVKAVSLWQDIFTTYPEVNVVFSIGAEGGPAAANVMQEKGLTSEEIVVIGISDIPETLDGIRSGFIFASMSENIPRIGYQPAEWICNYVRSGEAPKLINDTGTFPINKDNVDTYRNIENDQSRWSK